MDTLATHSPMEVDQKYQNFLAWAKQNDAFIHPSLDFVETKSCGVECVVGAKAKSIEPYEVFLRIPYKLTLSYWNAISAGKPESCYHPHHTTSLPKAFLETWTDHEIVNDIFLVQQHLLGKESYWYDYLQILPRPDGFIESATPLLWTEDELRWLRGTWFETEIPKKRKEFEDRWKSAINALAKCDWDTSAYTLELGLWAQFIFASRSFSTLAIEPDFENIKDDYHSIFKSGASIDDVPKILVPVLDLLNHNQRSGMGYDFNDTGLGLRKVERLAPGDQIWNPYDKDTKRYNNTLLLKEFGFILPDNEAPELVLIPPFDLSQSPMHPSHVIFSTSSTSDEEFASSEEIYIDLLTVRAPRRHPLGLMNPSHEARALRHFHPKFVSMVSFKVATLIERAALRKDPYVIPSRRDQLATVEFLGKHLRGMLQRLVGEGESGKASGSNRQVIAERYKKEQITIIREVLEDMAIQSDLFLVSE